MHSLAIALSTEQTILRNTCKTLLGSIVDPQYIQPLLADPFGSLWQNPDIKTLVDRRLDHTLKDFEALIYSMKEEVEGIRIKLGLWPDFKIRVKTRTIAKRDIIKIALQFSTHEASLEKIADINRKLDLMIASNRRNELNRKVQSPERLLSLLQTLSRSIFNALRNSLSCTCAPLHGVGFGLPTPRVTTTGYTQDEEKLIKRLEFHLVLANRPQDNKGKARSTWVWDELVLRLVELPTNVCPTPTLPIKTGMAGKNSRSKRVQFVDNTIELSMKRLAPLKIGISQSSQGFETSPQTLAKSLGQIPSPQLVQVRDICRILSDKGLDVEHQVPYGYLLDETSQQQQRFEMYPFKSSYNGDDCTMVCLSGVFSPKNRPSLAQKYHISATVASSVLFMYNTSWMPTTLTAKDVFLVSRHGNVDLREIYLAKKSLHNLANSSSASNHSPSRETSGRSTLYYLGIMLIEVMLWRSVSEFWDDDGQNIGEIPLEDILDYTTAKGFSRIEAIMKQIEWISSPDFREVVEHCIKCDLNAITLSLDDNTFRQAVYNDIVLPLQDADRLLGARYEYSDTHVVLPAVILYNLSNKMSDKQPNPKPPTPPKDQPATGDQKGEQGKGTGSLDWLVEAANYEPPKSTGDWMKDDGKIV
ncbi:hypothetical protein NPX13_g4473 [Xylaria arbuscula]|uniref:DUF7580 domain-containing protein n=1 Tax=Xylaria arbuscula TaxID=114810 RepID=A0A9W8NGA5_9PEZI|nr:hypothetical protein NPX13_g4473 [Xylaria arbuscula]